MIGQFAPLCRIKELREEKLLAAVEGARRALAAARVEEVEAEKRVRENKPLMAERERAIYAALVGKIATLSDFEKAREAVRKLETAHQKLVEDAREAVQQVKKLEEELADLRSRHRQSVIDRDKYRETRRDLEMQVRKQADFVEELEMEEVATRLLANR